MKYDFWLERSLTLHPQAISEVIFTASHLTDTDKQNSETVYKQNTLFHKNKQCKIQQNKTTLVQSPLMILGHETTWAYSTIVSSPHKTEMLASCCIKVVT